MEFNPYADSYNKLEKIIAKLNEDKESAVQDLNWYYNTDVENLRQELQQRNFKSKLRKSQVKGIEAEITALLPRVNEIEANIKTIFNPLNWFSSDQKILRQERSELRKSIAVKEEEKRSELNSIEASKIKAGILQSNIEKFQSFDVEKNKTYLEELENTISLRQTEFEELAEHKLKVDLALNPIIKELKHLESARRTAQNAIGTANDYDRELSNADNSYEKAMIHEKCERNLGEGSPKKAINKQEKMLRQIERDIDKAQKRASEVGLKASRIIKTVIIDGNNMCYEMETFVGINPLKEVTAELQKRFNVILVFDSAIRKMLMSHNAEIVAQFGSNMKVHIVANKQFADETILDLASNNITSYVISNDRFGDFNEKEVVKNNRMIRHEVVNNRVLIHDLDINVGYA